MMTKLILLDSDPISRAAIETVLATYNFDVHCVAENPAQVDAEDRADYFWLKNEGEVLPAGYEVKQQHQFIKPLRLGVLLDRLARHFALQKQQQAEADIAIGDYILHGQSNTLSRANDEEAISLTDKEAHILSFLARCDGTLVDRETLLGEVWGYAKDVETHTLETHIYRLRQKIENDPANPKLLITEEQGYRLVSA